MRVLFETSIGKVTSRVRIEQGFIDILVKSRSDSRRGKNDVYSNKSEIQSSQTNIMKERNEEILFNFLNGTSNCMKSKNFRRDKCSRFQSFDQIRQVKKEQSIKGKSSDNIDQIVKFLMAQKSTLKSNTLVTANNELTQLSSFRIDQNKARKTSNMTYIDNLTVQNRFLQMKVRALDLK